MGKTTYSQLSDADKALVDRAVFHDMVTMHNGQFHFSAAERVKHGWHNPNSYNAEWDIMTGRDAYANQLATGGAAFRGKLQQQGRHSPDNATAMLKAISDFNGNECGCELNTPDPVAVPLNKILSPLRGHHR